MSLDRNRARQLLAKGELQSIFIEELGWDRHSSPLEITAAGAPVRLQALAQKRGMVVYHCPPPSGESLPDYPHRRKIEQQVAKSAHEHLIVFTDADNETQDMAVGKTGAWQTCSLPRTCVSPFADRRRPVAKA